MRWLVRGYQAGDEGQIVDLFARVFGHERSMAHWRWKFLCNPMGHHITLAVAEDGSLVGQFAGLPVLVADGGQTVTFTQGIDHMVEEGWRKKGVYRGMADHFFGSYLAGQVTAWYAFPIQQNFEIEVKAFGCAGLHHPVPILVWDLSRAEPWRPSWRHTWRYRAEQVGRVGPAVDRLWQRCRSDLSLAAVRDHRYLNWRYADCPDVEYRFVVARDRLTEQVAGLAVMRFGWFEEPVAPVVDWLVPAGHSEIARVLLIHCHDLAREKGLKAVQIWLPRGSWPNGLLRSLGYQAEPSPFILSGRGQRVGDDLGFIGNRWFYTMGDSDIY